jgi:hypothetical protein
MVGQPATFRVELSGLDVASGEFLDFLAATVDLQFSLLGSPTAPTPGSIVPDPTGFLSASFPGTADALYDQLFATTGDPVTTNGVFFEFVVTPLVPGSGAMHFSFVDGTPGMVSPGADLQYTVVAPQSVIPEPASLCVWGFLAVAGFTVFLRTYRRTADVSGNQSGSQSAPSRD